MTIQDWLRRSVGKLEEAGIGTARLDCLVLLEDITTKSRAYLLAHPETILDKDQVTKLDKLVERRSHHEPLAYIREKTEFYGRMFYINHSVLEPRPETETMIELAKSLALEPNSSVADIGTDSGAIAITIKLE